MIEKKCKICGEWINSKKIAMHYWNIHHEKYGNYKDNEETREVDNVEGEIQNEKSPSKEEPIVFQRPTETKPETREIREEVKEVAPPVVETVMKDDSIVEDPKEPTIPEANPWLETVKYFEGPVTNETRNEVKKVVTHNWEDEGQTLNEWC
ncbi:MAG: hypothetical protein J6T10_01220 [Methanobrevibacter sp.]|nr:hypothetical protein [Methanobrevibacter sp.]